MLHCSYRATPFVMKVQAIAQCLFTVNFHVAPPMQRNSPGHEKYMRKSGVFSRSIFQTFDPDINPSVCLQQNFLNTYSFCVDSPSTCKKRTTNNRFSEKKILNSKKLKFKNKIQKLCVTYRQKVTQKNLWGYYPQRPDISPRPAPGHDPLYQ